MRARLAIVTVALVVLAVVERGASAKIPPPPPPPAPISVSMVGPKAVRVRVAIGVSMPCDSSNNGKLFDGKVEPGWSQTWVASAACVCIEQTYESFPDVGWGDPFLACRPMVMTPWGWQRGNDPIVVTLSSTAP